MAEIPDIKESVRQTVLDYYREECRDLIDNWHGLEVKAQGTAAVAGIFIAGALAYLREMDSEFHVLARVFIVLTLLLLIVSVVYSILALSTQKKEAPPMGDYVLTLANDVLQLEDEQISERLPGFFNAQMDGWKKVRDEAEHLIAKKARYFRWAQGCVLVASIIIAVLALIKAFH